MALTKISGAEVTDFSSKSYASSAAAQDSTLYPSSFETTAAQQTTESEYQNTGWTNQLGAYLEISELGGMIDRKAMYVVGEGIKTKNPLTKRVLNRIKGNGKQSADMVFYNAVRTYTAGGDFFAEIVGGPGRKLQNLKPLNPSTVKVIANNKGIIKHYEIFPITTSKGAAKASVTLQPNKMFHLQYNPIADQIHGQSTIAKLEPIINMRREAMQDLRVVFHRYVKPLWVISVDTDDATEIATFKAKMDSTIEKAENLIVPKDTVSNIERIAIPQFSTLDPLPWLKLLQREFIKAEGIPELILGLGGEATEAESKMLYLAWEQIVSFNQKFIVDQVKNQLGLNISLEFPRSIAPALIATGTKSEPTGATSQKGVNAKNQT